MAATRNNTSVNFKLCQSFRNCVIDNTSLPRRVSATSSMLRLKVSLSLDNSPKTLSSFDKSGRAELNRNCDTFISGYVSFISLIICPGSLWYRNDMKTKRAGYTSSWYFLNKSVKLWVNGYKIKTLQYATTALAGGGGVNRNNLKLIFLTWK